MRSVMISLDEEHERLLRKLAHDFYDAKKGSLSLAVKDALELLWGAKRKKGGAGSRFVRELERGLDFEYRMYSKRSELYD